MLSVLLLVNYLKSDYHYRLEYIHRTTDVEVSKVMKTGPVKSITLLQWKKKT